MSCAFMTLLNPLGSQISRNQIWIYFQYFQALNLSIWNYFQCFQIHSTYFRADIHKYLIARCPNPFLSNRYNSHSKKTSIGLRRATLARLLGPWSSHPGLGASLGSDGVATPVSDRSTIQRLSGDSSVTLNSRVSIFAMSSASFGQTSKLFIRFVDIMYTEHSFLIRSQSGPLDAFSTPLISNSRPGLVMFVLYFASRIKKC